MITKYNGTLYFLYKYNGTCIVIHSTNEIKIHFKMNGVWISITIVLSLQQIFYVWMTTSLNLTDLKYAVIKFKRRCWVITFIKK